MLRDQRTKGSSVRKRRSSTFADVQIVPTMTRGSIAAASLIYKAASGTVYLLLDLYEHEKVISHLAGCDS